MRMSCKNIQNSFVQLLQNELSKIKYQSIQQHLEKCSRCREAFKDFQMTWDALGAVPNIMPPAKMEDEFEVMLRAYKRGMQEAAFKTGPLTAIESLKTLFSQPAWKFALPLLLLCSGFLLGSLFNSQREQSRFANISNQMDDMRQLVMLSLLKQESSVERLQAVNWSYQVQQPKDQVRDALRRTLIADPNVNVRLAALRALQPWAGDPLVRKDIIDSFPQQKSPLMQTEIIDFIQRYEQRPAEMLTILREERPLEPAVKQHLEWNIGLLKGETFYKENKNEINSNSTRVLPLPPKR